MNKIKLLLMAIAIATLASCGSSSTVPLSGRKHRISVSDGELLSLSTQEYKKFMASAKRSTNAKNTQMVERVGRKLANAVESYLRNNGYANELQNFQWEFNLVQDNQANAFCMPGGKIVVYEGLFPYTQNEASLAIVLGHEIAHAVAKHSAEQMTKKQNQGIGTAILGTVLNSTMGSGVGDIATTVANGVFTFRNASYSRSNESEADYMGLIFAAMAGYDPQEAVGFWQRMAASKGSGAQTSLSSYLSSHPSDATRIKNIQGWMPEALKYYQASGAASPRPARTFTAKKPAKPAKKKGSKRR
ncbi:M48 family metallopeptidase [Prevotella sp. HUN102]|uniref:M48 family metallopeptidase n=1 Tax=Prevotella sp. HUN102 TaxID=1392486 RepID=UPI00048EA4E4|nr:M48 family metallopeptidase [Prevotella sp. HUN102]